MAKNAIQLEIRGDDKASAVIKKLAEQFDKASDNIVRDGKKAQAAWNNFTGAMKKGETAISNTVNRLTSLQGLLIGGGIVYGLKRIGRSALDVAASFEQMELKLGALTKTKGTEILEELNQWALEMPVNTRKTVDAFTMMMAMGLKPTTKELGVLVDVATLFGEVAMPRIARALGQMQQLGRLSAEELNQLAEVGINARGYVQDAFGTTVEEIQKMGVAIEDIIAVIWKGLEEDFGGAARKGMETWQGLTATFTSYVEEIERQVMAAGVFQELKEQLGDINDQLKEWLQVNGDIIKQRVPEYIKKVKDTAENMWDWLQANSDLIEFGLIGLALFGKKGAIIGVGLGAFSDYLNKMLTAIDPVLDALQTKVIQAQENVNELRRAIEEAEEDVQVESLAAEDISQQKEQLRLAEARLKNVKDTLTAYQKEIEELKELTLWEKEFLKANKETIKEIEKQTEAIEKTGKGLQNIEAWYKKFYKANKVEMDKWIKENKELEEAGVKAYEVYWEERIKIYFEGQEKIKREGEKARKEKEQAEKQMIRRLDREWEQFGERMYNTLSDSIYLFIDKGLDSFEDMLDTIENYFKRTFANIIAWIANQKIVMPIVAQIVGGLGMYVPAGIMGAAGLPGGTGAGGFGIPPVGGVSQWIPGVSEFLSTPIWGAGGIGAGGVGLGAVEGASAAQMAQYGYGVMGPTWGATLGAGAIGAFGYPILADLTGLPQSQYSSPLAGVGAGLGFMFGGPLGAVAGGLGGGLLGGMIGGEQEPKTYVQQSLIADLIQGVYTEAIFSGWPQELQNLAAQTFDPMIDEFSTMAQWMKELSGLTDEQIAKLSEMTLLYGQGEIYVHDLMKGAPIMIEQQAEAFQKEFLKIMGVETLEELDRLIRDQLTDMASEWREFIDEEIFKKRVEEGTIQEAAEYIDQVTAAIDLLQRIIDPEHFTTVSYAIEQLTKMYEKQAEKAQELGISLDLVNEAYQAEIERLTIAPLESLLERIAAYKITRERKEWRFSEWQEYYEGLTQELAGLDPTTETYYEDSLKLLEEQFQVLQIIEQLAEAEAVLREMNSQSIENLIEELTVGRLAPVQSAEAVQRRYDELMDIIESSTDPEAIAQAIRELEAFLPEYLSFFEDFGMDYKDLNAQVVEDLQGIYDTLNIGFENFADLSDLLEEGNIFAELEVDKQGETNILLDDLTQRIQEFIDIIRATHEGTLELPSPPVEAGGEGGEEGLGEEPEGGWWGRFPTGYGIAGETFYGPWQWFGKEKPISPIYETTWGKLPSEIPGVQQIEGGDYGTWGYPGFQAGGFAFGPSIVGEKGIEVMYPLTPSLVMPTYEPEQSILLNRMGIDPAKIAANVARYISEIGAGNREVIINLNAVIEVDGHVIGDMVADQTRVHIDLIEGIRRLTH